MKQRKSVFAGLRRLAVMGLLTFSVQSLTGKTVWADGSSTDSDGWTDVTDLLLTNPDFDGGNAIGWTVSGSAALKAGSKAMEFYDGSFNISQHLYGLPKGEYRLSVQAFYRMCDNESALPMRLGQWAEWGMTEQLTAMLYAGDNVQALVSVYSFEFPKNVSGCWDSAERNWWGQQITTAHHYYPNNMYSGSQAFKEGAYWNVLEFGHEGDLTIGIVNEEDEDSWWGGNWCMFDNFKLEFKGTVVRATSLQATLADREITSGDVTTASVTAQPSNALVGSIVWTSSDESVATVSLDGTVTGVKAGTATITATSKDDPSLTASVTIKVVKNIVTSDQLVINEIMASNVDEFISPAFNFDGWVELYNPSDRKVRLSGLYLSTDAQDLKKWRLPVSVGSLPSHGFVTIWFDSNDLAEQNAPFKLDTDGGTVYVSDEDGQVIASQTYPASKERVSYARTTDGGATWGLTAQATPGATNTTSAFATEQLETPVVDQPSQLFTGSLSVRVTIPTGSTLRYTDDGTLPTLDNGKTSADGLFTVSKTSNYRFRLFAIGKLPSRVTTRSYLLKNKSYTLPVVSVVADPDFLYDGEIGVMTEGYNGRPGNGKSYPCNWNMNWERPVNFSYLTPDGKMVLNQDVNLEMCGGWSRAWTPHSFKLKGTKELGGTKYLPYQFFSQKPYIRNRTLQIRNGGNDNNCRIKDAALQYIVETSGIDVDCQSYQPVHEFINGEYIGVLNVREPNNKHYVYANYGWDDDEIEQFEMSPDSGYVQKCGSPDMFNHLVDDLSPNAADAATYKEICDLLDIDAYANYMAVEMYLGSTDWPQNNVKGFRNVNGGKFRFVLFDIDHAFGTTSSFSTFMSKEKYTFDQLYPTSLGRITDQIRFVTLFKNLLQNATFRKKFIDAYCLVGGSVFQPQRVNTIVNELVSVARPAMQLTNESPSNTANQIKSSLNNRLNTMINTLRNYSAMQLNGVQGQKVKLSSNVESARLLVNGRDVPTGSFDGTLFPPIELKAKAPRGYSFQGWQDADGKTVYTSDTYTITGLGDMTLTAVFEHATTDDRLLRALAMPIKVNEVSAGNSIYCNDYFKRNDWFELYNNTDQDLDAAGLYVSDDVNNPLKFQIPAGGGAVNTIIPAGGYLVVWADGLTPLSQMHASFKLSNAVDQVVIVSSSDEFVRNNARYFEDHPGLASFVDVLPYGIHLGEQSVGRFPDGGSTFYVMNRPTIDRTNTMVPTDKATGVDRSWMELADHKFTLDLAQGWNWVSHIIASPIGRGSLSAQAQRILSADGEAYLDSKLGMTGTLKQLEAGQLYKVQMKQADIYTSTAAFCDTDLPIALRAGWNWVGYTANGAQDLTHALGSTPVQPGDVILSQDGTATYTADGWTGSLTTLETGKGYMYKSVGAKTLRFASPAVKVRMDQSRVREAAASKYGVDKHAYPNVMGVIARLQLDGQTVDTDRFTLLAYAGDECRGEGKWVDGRLWMNVYGDGGETVTFRAIDQMDGTAYAVKETTAFASDVLGTYDAPRLLTLTDVIDASLDIASLSTASGKRLSASVTGYYSLGGTLVAHRAAALREGIYIVRYSNGQCRKVLAK